MNLRVYSSNNKVSEQRWSKHKSKLLKKLLFESLKKILKAPGIVICESLSLRYEVSVLSLGPPHIYQV